MGVCRVRRLIPAPLPRVWEFVSDPRNMSRWVPYIESVAGPDRPLQAGDRLTVRRRDFYRRHSRELLVEEVVPYRSFRVRVLSGGPRRMSGGATLTVEGATDPGATWMEEAIAYSFGDGPIARRVDRWLVNHLLQVLLGWKTSRAFRRLGELLAPGHEDRQPAAGPAANEA